MTDAVATPADAVDAALARLAATGQTATYGALARDLGLRMAVLTMALEQTMALDHAAGAPYRASLCRGRLEDGFPARGFFAKAMELGRPIERSADCLAAEREAVFRVYRPDP